MKRPLCYICVAYVVTVFIYLKLNPLPATASVESEGSRVSFLGEVYGKEYKSDKLILYLKHVKKRDPNKSETELKTDTYEKDIRIMCCMKPESGRIAEPRLGSIVAVEGEVSAFREARNPGSFDMRLYYKILKLDFQTWNTVLVAESAAYSEYREGLYRIRRHFEGIFDKVLPKKDASIMKAMALGNKTQLDTDSKLLYQQSGISHVFAISGLHITLIGMGLYQLLRKIRIPVVISALLSILFMIVYGDMVGMSSSAYRAVFMFGMKMLAAMLRRTYDMLNAVAMAAVLLLIEQPLYLYYSGFLLSFGAILGVGCVLEAVSPDSDKFDKDKTLGRRILDKAQGMLCASFSIFLIQFPIMLCSYYEFPVYSFLLNLIIIPSMTVMMGLGLLCLACGSIPAVFGIGMAKIAALGCHFFIGMFEWFSRLSLSVSGANWIVGKPDSWRVYCFYAAVLFLYMMHEYGKRISKYGQCTLPGIKIGLTFPYKMLLMIVAVSLISSRSISGLGITFLDVGQGDGIWIETPLGHHYLIDSGSTSENRIGQYTLVPFLKYTGTSKLDAVFLTHLDQDHVSGVMELLSGDAGTADGVDSGIKIEKIVVSSAVIKDDAYLELAGLCEEKGISLVYMAAGEVIAPEKGVQLEILHPKADYRTESRNAYSLVMKLTYFNQNGQFGALFTGDVEADGEQAVSKYLSAQNWNCQLYKAAHHGSRYSNTKELLSCVQPSLTVVSCGNKNSYGHPHAETLERLNDVGSKVLATKDTGAIIVRVRNGVVKVTSFLNKF